MPPSDADLLRACRAGDANAWERLLEHYERLVFSIALGYGLNPDDAADITQITFTILLQQLDSVPDDVHLAGWLATVARRHTWRALARQRREVVGADADLSENEALGGTADPRERTEQMVWIAHGLRLLDERCSQLLFSLYFDDQQPSYAQVAERLRMPLGSIGPTRARCLEQMKRLLSGAHPALAASTRPAA
jgi:RNA polymerase sigma factor (sigma-70 family)